VPPTPTLSCNGVSGWKTEPLKEAVDFGVYDFSKAIEDAQLLKMLATWQTANRCILIHTYTGKA
jgi:hypothetical protein